MAFSNDILSVLVAQVETNGGYTTNDHYTTNDASFIQVETNYDFDPAVQHINPFFALVRQIWCRLR